MGPSYRFKRKDKSVPSTARMGVGPFPSARERTGSRRAEMSAANFIVVVVVVGGGGWGCG